MVTLIVRLPKYWSRSLALSSASRPASFCSATRHSSAEVHVRLALGGRYRSRGRVAHRKREKHNGCRTGAAAFAPTGDSRVDAAVAGLAALEEVDLTERPAVLEEVHDRLREVLGELGARSARRPGARRTRPAWRAGRLRADRQGAAAAGEPRRPGPLGENGPDGGA